MNNQIAIRKHVFKRDGTVEPFNTQKLLLNLERVVRYLGINIQPIQVTRHLQITMQRYKITRMTTQELSKKVALTAMYHQQEHPDFAALAQRIEIISLHKSTSESFTEVMTRLYHYRDPNTNTHLPLISRSFYNIVEEHGRLIEDQLILRNDDKYNYLPLRILQESYLLRINGEVVERPQHMLMRVALAVWPVSLDEAFEVYNSLSNHYFVPSHLMLKNAGLPSQQYQTSAALTLNPSGSGVSNCLNQVQMLASVPMDIGIGITGIISEGKRNLDILEEYSKGVHGFFQTFHNDYSNVPRHIPGPVAFYLEIWHEEIFEFIGSNNEYSPNVSYNVVIPDIFMRRLANRQKWSLMCPSKCSKLINLHGDEFDCFYEGYEIRKQYESQIQCLDIWAEIIEVQKLRGYPSIVFKDNITRPSNCTYLGSINNSNKYTNFAMHSSSKNPASAHSAYLVLPTFCKPTRHSFDYAELGRQTQIVTKFLNKAIDVSDYGTQSLKRYNKLNRPLAIGVHGLADLFRKLKLTYPGRKSEAIDKEVFNIIYHNALEASCDLARRFGPYPTFRRSRMSERGYLHIDDWKLPKNDLRLYKDVRQNIRTYGVRNSALISLKSDKRTSQIMDVSNSVDLNNSLVFKIEGFGDSFTVMDERLLRNLVRERCWNPYIRNEINQSPCVIWNITGINLRIKKIFRTASEMSSFVHVVMAKGRAPFIDQSQSTKIWGDLFSSNVQQMAWLNKLKTVYKVVAFKGLDVIKLTKDNDPEDNNIRYSLKKQSPALINEGFDEEFVLY